MPLNRTQPDVIARSGSPKVALQSSMVWHLTGRKLSRLIQNINEKGRAKLSVSGSDNSQFLPSSEDKTTGLWLTRPAPEVFPYRVL